MSLTESQKILSDRGDNLFARLKKDFKRTIVNDMSYFITDKGEYFDLVEFPNDGCFVIEYAENLSDAKKNIFEDGDLFCLEDMDEDEMYEAMLKEINQ